MMDDIEKLFNVKIDRARLKTLEPVEQSIQLLNLPAIRFRKLNTILNALTMQIEDGGDDPTVNGYLVKALRAAVIAQVGGPAENLSIEAGYWAMETYNSLAACKTWLEGWAIVRRLAQPNIKTRADFMRIYRTVDPQFSHW